MAKSKAKSTSKKHLFAVLVIVFLAVIIVCIWLLGHTDPQGNDPNILTISTGTQGRFENIDVALGDIQSGSAFIYLHQEGTSNEQTKKVMAGDKIEAFGYEIEVKSINKAYNPSRLIGASHGNIKLLINKK